MPDLHCFKPAWVLTHFSEASVRVSCKNTEHDTISGHFSSEVFKAQRQSPNVLKIVAV